MRRMLSHPFTGAFLLLLLFLCTATLRAQSSTQATQPVTQTVPGVAVPTPPPATGPTHADVMARLQASGLSRSSVRTLLSAAGLNAGMADPYFDAAERGVELPSGSPSTGFLDAMKEIGLSIDAALPDSLLRTDSAAMADTAHSVIFGRDVFRRLSTQFTPLTSGPVDGDYRLGVGDELAIVFTGEVQAAYTLPLMRDGTVVLPDVGAVRAAGLRLNEFRAALVARASERLPGLSGGTTQVAVTIGRLRAIQVFVIGEAASPGAYQVSSVATAFYALYAAGGPSENGSFRSIELRRGGKLLQKIDLYDYLLHGNSSADVRLEQGDVLFIPIARRRASVSGQVRRPATFEMAEGESLGTLIGFAGGLDPKAVRRIQIDRILSPAERKSGVDRTLIDIDIADMAKPAVRIEDGDAVYVNAVSEERRNRVSVTGEVNRPGLYEWKSGMLLSDLVQRAEGFTESAYTPRVHVFRLNPETRFRTLVAQSKTPLSTPLADRDSVVVYSTHDLLSRDTVSIGGYVKRAAAYELAGGMTVSDLVIAAGGFRPGANTTRAEIVRRRPANAGKDTTAILLAVPLTNGGSSDSAPIFTQDAEAFQLQPDDRVFVRKDPSYEDVRTVVIAGQVASPGPYVLSTRKERLADVLKRAGGAKPDADLDGLRIVRSKTLVATDARKALSHPETRFNVTLENGDSIYVPKFNPTVLVTGAVAFESRVLYVPGRDMSYYISQAGGFSPTADHGRAVVMYADGSRNTTHRSFLFASRDPHMKAGASIFIPAKPASAMGGFDFDKILSRTLTAATSIATLLVVIRK